MKAGIIGTLVYLVLFIAGVIGWFMNLFHCIGYIGTQTDDSTAEVIIRIVGVFTFLPGAIMGYI